MLCDSELVKMMRDTPLALVTGHLRIDAERA